MKHIAILVFLFSVSAFANTDCPEGSVYTQSTDGVHYCVFEDMQMPSQVSVESYCQYIYNGYMGFSFSARKVHRQYQCPEGMRKASNGEGTWYCTFNVETQGKNNLRAYCDYLDSGVIGFSWRD